MALASKILRQTQSRCFHSSPSIRILSPSSSRKQEFNVSPEEAQERLGELATVVSDVAKEAGTHDYTTERFQTRVWIGDKLLVPPVELNRKYLMNRPVGRKVANLGPGREARYDDIFLQFGIDPRHECDNIDLLSGFVTRLGRIQPRSVTGLSQRSQRLVGKAIKRAKMMGIIPFFHSGTARRLQVVSRNVTPLAQSQDKGSEGLPQEREGSTTIEVIT